MCCADILGVLPGVISFGMYVISYALKKSAEKQQLNQLTVVFFLQRRVKRISGCPWATHITKEAESNQRKW